VFPRFPIFDEDSGPNAARMVSSLTVGDRFFVAEAVREILLAHMPHTSQFCLTYGAIKYYEKGEKAYPVTEQVLAVASLLPAHLSTSVRVVAVAEAVFSLTLTAASSPSPVLPVIYLGRVLLELTKIAPVTFSPIVPVAIELIYRELPTIPPPLRIAFADTFAFFLVNMNMVWPFWNFWNEASVGADSRPCRQFVKRVFHSLLNVTSVENVRRSLPTQSPLLNLIPASLEFNSPLLAQGDSALGAIVADCKGRVSRREPWSEISQWLCQSPHPSISGESMFRVRAAVAAVLSSGSYSLTDTRTFLGRYKDLLTAAVKADCAEAGGNSFSGYGALVSEVIASWGSSPTMQRFVLEILCRLRVIEPAVIIEYLVGVGYGLESLTSRSDLWDTVDCCMRIEPNGTSEEERGNLLAAATASCIKGVYERVERNPLQKKDPLYVSLVSGMKKILSTALEVSGAERHNVLRSIDSITVGLNGGTATVVGTFVVESVSCWR
jgi:hypothetical protein